MINDLITPKEKNYSQWYLDIIKHAGLAENSEVQGCMVIKPYGYSIWENIRTILDNEFRRTGHKNAYFPLFIPLAYFSKEANHVEGFAKECAVVTHSRLKSVNGEIQVDETSRLNQPMVVRPTSETIIWNTFRDWIQSYRDLPLLINQWANIVRMEMRTRPFLRTSEFLWQEGHTAHSTKEDALNETMKILEIYSDFCEKKLSIPVEKGVKTISQRFAGADETYCIESLMQDGKALQMGTSHYLGQNFAKAFNVMFCDISGRNEYVHATSWGVSTRLIGGLIMTHSDNSGLVLPPEISPVQVIFIPVLKNDVEKEKMMTVIQNFKSDLESNGITVSVDERENLIPKQKFIDSEIKGIPVRVEIGSSELNEECFTIFRRDEMKKEKISFGKASFNIKMLLSEIQINLFEKAKSFRDLNSYKVFDFEEFKEKIEKGGFIHAYWNGRADTEEEIKSLTKATIRCIPINSKKEKGKCILTNEDSDQLVIFARAY